MYHSLTYAEAMDLCEVGSASAVVHLAGKKPVGRGCTAGRLPYLVVRETIFVRET